MRRIEWPDANERDLLERGQFIAAFQSYRQRTRTTIREAHKVLTTYLRDRRNQERDAK